MNVSQSIEVQLSGRDGRFLSVSNVLLQIQFFTRGNRRYAFVLGRTSSAGQLNATYADIERLRRRDAEQNLMDYNTPLEECDSCIQISIPSDRELRQWFDNAMRSYGRPPDWASDWPSNKQVNPSKETLLLAEGKNSINLKAE